MSNKIKLIIIFLTIIALGGAISTGVLWGRLHQSPDPVQQAQVEIEKTVSEVGQFLLLPEDETPTLATVTDLAKLQSQPFFNHAEVGDKVIVYSISKKVILWRPSIHKVIEVSSLETNASK